MMSGCNLGYIFVQFIGSGISSYVRRDRMPITNVGILQAVQVGTPQQYCAEGVTHRSRLEWETSFVRTPSAQPRWLYTTHLDGSEQADKKNHGRLDQAVLMYAATHYPLWQEELGRSEIGPGGFGENFTVDGLTEETVCIGDIYALGAARIQVTGARYPCSKIEKRWDLAGLTARVAETGRSGWYCCVLQEGMIEPGMSVQRIEHPYPQWTIALTNDYAHFRNTDLETAKALVACPFLDDWWKELIMRRATAAPVV
jgi:MOSC domain-containing protein YiiM